MPLDPMPLPRSAKLSEEAKVEVSDGFLVSAIAVLHV
jgi:hypothetical protein